MTNRDAKTRQACAPPLRVLALSAVLGGIPQPEQQGVSSILVDLGPERPKVFWIDANRAVTFTLPADRRDLRLVFKDPNGMVWELAAPTSETPSGLPYTIYGTTIQQPAPGAWTLSVSSAEPLLGFPMAHLRIAYTNQVQARLSIPRQTFVSGESPLASLELMDGTSRVKDLRTTATMTRLEDPTALPIFVSFHDDGSHGDRIARDGLYTATLPAEVPGRFHLEAQIEGIASTGRCHRTIDCTFKVVPKAARITGNITQRILTGTPD